MNNLKQMKSRKSLVIIAISIIAIGSLFTYKISLNKQEVKKQQEYEALVLSIETLENDLNKLYVDESYDFLNETVSIEKLQKLEDKYDLLNNKTNDLDDTDLKTKTIEQLQPLNSLSLDILNKLKTQQLVNELFQDSTIIGDVINFELAIADDLTQESVQAIEVLHIQDKNSKWLEVILSLIDNANRQVEHITSTTDQVNNFFFKDVVIENPDNEQYEKLVDAVADIKNIKARNELQTKMDIVLAKITENIKLEAELSETSQEDIEQIKEAMAEIENGSEQSVNENKLAVSPERTGEKEVRKQEKVERETPKQTTQKSQKNESEKKETPTSSQTKEVGKTVYQGKNKFTGGDEYGYEGPPISTLEELSKVEGVEIGNVPWENGNE